MHPPATALQSTSTKSMRPRSTFVETSLTRAGMGRCGGAGAGANARAPCNGSASVVGSTCIADAARQVVSHHRGHDPRLPEHVDETCYLPNGEPRAVAPDHAPIHDQTSISRLIARSHLFCTLLHTPRRPCTRPSPRHNRSLRSLAYRPCTRGCLCLRSRQRDSFAGGCRSELPAAPLLRPGNRQSQRSKE